MGQILFCLIIFFINILISFPRCLPTDSINSRNVMNFSYPVKYILTWKKAATAMSITNSIMYVKRFIVINQVIQLQNHNIVHVTYNTN